MKTLKTTKLYVRVCYNNLKSVPPKEYTTIEEMEKSREILKLLKGKIEDFTQLQDAVEAIMARINDGEKVEQAETNEINRRIKKKDDEDAKETVSIGFEDAEFNTFFQQFERWGKNWFNKVDDFLAFRSNMNETNKQPKEEK